MVQADPKTQPGRIEELDAIRGLAALGVMIFHLYRDFWFGVTGVELFFVLSGYLISTIILANRHRPGFLRTFYARRALRIFPIYYLYIILIYLLNMMSNKPRPTSGYFFYFVYLQNLPYYWGGAPPEMSLPLGQTWTLAIEEQFYLLWPCLLLLAPRRIWWFGIGLALLSSVLRYEGLHGRTLLAHMDGLLLGAMLAGLQWNWSWFRSRTAAAWMLALAGVAIVAYFTGFHFCLARSMDAARSWRGNVGMVIVSIAYFGLIGGLSVFSGSRALAFLRLKALTGLGTISYGLYLYHVFVFAALNQVFGVGTGGHRWWLDALKVGGSIGLACVSWQCIEKPILKLKDRFGYGKKVAEAAPVDFEHGRIAQRQVPC